MLRLDTTTRKLQIVLAAAVATNELPVFVCYSDKSASTYIGAPQRSASSGATAVDICGAPAASVVRDVDLITVVNSDTASATVTLRLDDNGTYATLFKATLEPGDQIGYTHGQGWKTLDRFGAPKNWINDRFQITAGTAISKDATVQIGMTGKAYPVSRTDYALVTNCAYGTAQTSTATGIVIADTAASSTGSDNNVTTRDPIAVDADGNIFSFTTNGASTQTLLKKYSPLGVLLATVTVDATVASNNAQIVVLSNGNVAVFAHASNSTYAVYDSNLVVVKANTIVDAAQNGASLCALSGGGFAIVYVANATPTLNTLVTYNNSGTAVLAATTIWTRTGTAGNQYHSLAQLSNGNLLVAVDSQNSSGDVGLFYGVVTTGGASVSAFASLDTATLGYMPEVSVMPGYFCVSEPNGSNVKASVFSNAGVLQGGAFTGTTTTALSGNPQSSYLTKVLNDGVSFFLIWPQSSDTTEKLTKLPTSGTGFTTTDITTIGTSNYRNHVDAFHENGFIVCAFTLFTPASSTNQLLVIDSTTGIPLSNSLTGFGTAATNACRQRILSGGDFTFICGFSPTSGGTHFAAGKYGNTAIVGVASSPAAAGAQCNLYQGAGTYTTNTLKGSPSVAFDHTTGSNIYGNKGAMLTHGTVLRGM